MYHVPHDSGVTAQYNYNTYRENRRSTPSYALVPHSSSSTSNRRVQYTYPPVRHRAETPYHPRYSSEHTPRLYGDSRDHVDTYQEQRYVIPYNNGAHAQ